MKLRTMFACLVLAVSALAGLVRADAVAKTAVNTITTLDNAPFGATVGDTFSVSSGSFTSYTAPAGEPQITTDLAAYHYILSGTVTSASGATVDYSGTYRIFYDINSNHAYDPLIDTSVSFGNATYKASFFSQNSANFTGTLIQTSGPSGPFAGSFVDLSQFYKDGKFSGLYTGGTNTLVSQDLARSTGTVQGTLTLESVPLPSIAWAAVLLLGIAALTKLRPFAKRC